MTIRTPKYRLHKPSGQALVQLDGRRIYLGKHGTEQSQEKYRRLVADWLVNRPPQPVANGEFQSTRLRSELTINELLLLYWRFASSYYVKGDRPTKELACMRDALRPLRQLYSQSLVADFGPLALKALQKHLIAADISRGVINQRTNRLKRMFKWAASEELISISVYEALRTVSGLRYGRTAARETAPVTPVATEAVQAVLPFVSPQIAAMIQLQLLTGMRAGEVVLMRVCDIDRSGDVWIYKPSDHKNDCRGHHRLVALGPQCQSIIRPFLDRCSEAYLFSPREAENWRLDRRSRQSPTSRKTPIYPSETRARERAKLARRQRVPARPKRERYDTVSYRRAIEYGIGRAKRAGVDVPH